MPDSASDHWSDNLSEDGTEFSADDNYEHFEELYAPSAGAVTTNDSWPATGDAYVPLTADDIALEQQELIRNVQDLTAVEGHISRQLLQEMKWSYESVAEVYYEDPERLLAKAGVTVTEAAASRKSLGHEKSGMNIEYNGSFTCQVCFDTFEGEEIVAKVCSFPTCGHAMCTDCWFQQLKTQIIDEGASVKIACPGFSTVDNKIVRCNVILDERFVGQVLKKVEDVGTNPDAKRTRQRYHKQLNDNYVNNNYCIKWCPATDCTSAVRIKDSYDKNSFRTEVMCSENHPWCFNCMDEPHAPADCQQVKDWRKKCAEDSATSSWLVKFTKDCPKCKIAINKDGGCNHMHCKQCDYHFCWVCLAQFDHASYQHTCNKYVEESAGQADSHSRSMIQRYLHYFDRFMNHKKSRELESKLRENTLSKMEKMQEEGNKTWIDVQFMKQATSQLIEARQLLQWTYVTGYYNPRWLLKNIFDMNQADLENATEKLSDMLECEDIMKWCNEDERVDMINQTNQVRTRLRHLLSALESWKTNHNPSDAEEETNASAGDKRAGAKANEELAGAAHLPTNGINVKRGRMDESGDL